MKREDSILSGDSHRNDIKIGEVGFDGYQITAIKKLCNDVVEARAKEISE